MNQNKLLFFFTSFLLFHLKARTLLFFDQNEKLCNLKKKRMENMKRRNHVVKEIVESERIYKDHIREYVRLIVIPSREERIVPPEAQRMLFCNIETIYEVSKEMYLQLYNISLLPLDKQNFGEFFISQIPLLKCYAIYCTNVEYADEMRKTLEETNTVYKHFIKMKYETMESTAALNSMESFIMKPMQRITKLPLLLKELIKSTEEDHHDFSKLEEALILLSDLVAHINEKKRVFEMRSEMLKILGNLKKIPPEFVLLQPHRVSKITLKLVFSLVSS